MPEITYRSPDGSATVLEVAKGISVMRGAVMNDVVRRRRPVRDLSCVCG
jgi:hypothetical protein